MAFLLKIVKVKNNFWERLDAEKLILVFSLTTVLIVNFQLLFAFFMSDDFLHFYQISNWNPVEFISSSYGGHLYIFRNLIFYCMFKLFGMHSVAYFSIVLLTHLGSAYILYKILHLLTNRPSLAAAGMIIWGICPVNYGSLGWYSAYGHVLVGFFFLLFLYDLFRMEKRKILFTINTAIRWSIYLFLIATSFGIGLAIACLAPVAIVIILWENDRKWEIALSILPVISLILLLFIFKDSIHYFFSGEVQRFKPVALSSALSIYKIILEMFIRICAYSIYCMAAFPMLFMSSRMQYPTAAIFISIPTVILFIVLFLRSADYKRRYYTVLNIFLFGLIGVIAYGRAPLCGIYHVPINFASKTPHFFYVILFIILIILVLMADELLEISPKISKVIFPFIFIVIVISIYPSIYFANKIDPMNKSAFERKLYYETIADIEKTIRAYPKGSSVLIDNKMNNHFMIFYPLDTDFPGKAAVFSIEYPTNTVEDRRVYFVEKDCRVADKNIEKNKWRISSLILSACNLYQQRN